MKEIKGSYSQDGEEGGKEAERKPDEQKAQKYYHNTSEEYMYKLKDLLELKIKSSYILKRRTRRLLCKV